MDHVRLGRTGLTVSAVGLGTGGRSRLGRRAGLTAAQSADLLRAALDLGVSIVDTASVYGTEEVVGVGVRGRRDEVVISSKARINRPGTSADGTDLVSATDLEESVETSLRLMATDRIDILHLHGVKPHQYPHCVSTLLPTLRRLRDQGKIRFLGITETFGIDLDHAMLRQAVADGYWDVVMLGLNFVNQSSLPLLRSTAENDIGTLGMFAVRGALANSDTLRALTDQLVEKGEIDRDALDANDPFGFLTALGVASSLTEAAYRYCRHTPGMHVVLVGTGNIDHLKDNIRALNRPPLPAAIIARLATIFGRVVSGTGDLPG